MKIIKTKDYEHMSRQAANLISAQVLLKPNCVLGLATGSTPLGIYKQLIEWYIRGDINFSQTRSVNLDEYCGLAPDHDQSYHYYMRENFFRHINIVQGNTYVPDGLAGDMEAEGLRYDSMIADMGGIDLQLLGIGNTGHIGFNEPADEFPIATHQVELAQETIDANSRFFKSAGEVPRHAITMGMKSIMTAGKILLIANGKGKSDILYRACFGPVTPQVPASILQLHPYVTVVADEEAAAEILQHHPEVFA